MRTAALAALVLLLAGLAPARANDFTHAAIATTGSEFLTQDLGARGIAMGGAYSAVVNDAYSLYWNPAGLAHVPRLSANFMYTRYVADISYQSAQAAARINDASVLAGGVRYRDIGSITQTDLSGDTVGTFHPRDYVVDAGWGQSVLDLSDSEMDVYMGVSGHWIHSDYMLKADGIGGDVGIQSRLYTSRYTYDVSFVAQNMGMGQKFDQVRDAMPFRARLGAAMAPIKPLTLSLEAILPISDVPAGAVGAEYALEFDKGLKAAMRAGFNSTTMDSLGFASCLSMGLGMTVGDFSFDYSFVPMGVLGSDTHRFSISFNLPAKASRRYRER